MNNSQFRLDANLTDAKSFLDTLGSFHSFQVLRDSGEKSSSVTQHGSFDKLSSWLISKNNAGYGIFVMINEGDGKGRKAENVTAIRAFFVDLDGAPYEDVLIAPLEPSIITESSRGRYHAYWLISDAPLETFSAVQKALAAKFKSDPAINDLPRIMRVPGFWHLKNTPVQSTLLQMNNVKYPYQQFIDAFEIVPYRYHNTADDSQSPSNSTALIQQGSRHTRLLSISGSLRNQGLTGQALTDALMKINNDNCSPPLPLYHVQKISASISAKPAHNSQFQSQQQKEQPYKPPTVISFSALQKTSYKPIQWIVRGLLPEGLTIIAGKAKLGKSWLAQSISIAVAQGSKALGYFDANQGPILSLSLEDTPRRYQARLNILLKNTPPPDNAFLSCEWARMPRGIEDMKKWLDSQNSPRLIVVDTLAKMKPTSAGYRSGTLYDRDYNDIEQLHRLAADYQIAILAVTHKNKSESEDDYDSVTGSAAMTGVADSIWIFNRKGRGTPQAKLNISGRDIADATYTLNWDSTAASWYYLPADNPTTNSARDRILQMLLDEQAPLTPSDISSRLGLSRGHAQKILTELYDDNQIQKSVNPGAYIALSQLSMEHM